MTNMKDGEWKSENYTHCQRTIIQRKKQRHRLGGGGRPERTKIKLRYYDY